MKQNKVYIGGDDSQQNNISYLLGATACAEDLITVFPATFEEADVGVIVDQMLLQMFSHTKDQRTAMPLSTQYTNNKHNLETTNLNQVIRGTNTL